MKLMISVYWARAYFARGKVLKSSPFSSSKRTANDISVKKVRYRTLGLVFLRHHCYYITATSRRNLHLGQGTKTYIIRTAPVLVPAISSITYLHSPPTMYSFLRPTRFLQQSLTTASTAKAVSAPTSCRRSFTCTLVSKSTSGYGDADQTGDDPSNKPNLQGSRPRIDTEHPGREPVDEGKGTGSGGYAETGEKKGGGREGTGGNGKSESVAERKGRGRSNTKTQKGGEMGVGLGSK